jgi:hypothetical protein
MPTVDRWIWRWLAALAGLYALELALRTAGADLGTWAWQPPGAGWAAWQPVTRFLVQGPAAVGQVLVALIVLGLFLLPSAGRWLSPRRIAEALAAGAVGGTLLPLALDGLTWAGVPLQRGTLQGWGPLLGALVLLIGLANRGGRLMLLLVVVPIEVPAALLVWGPPVVAGIVLLARLATGGGLGEPVEQLGIWAGAYAWWHLVGPGRRAPVRSAGRRSQGRLRVLPGGRSADRGIVHRGPATTGRGTVGPVPSRPRRA